MAKILICDPIAQKGMDMLKEAGHDVTIETYTPEQLEVEIAKYDGVIVRSATKIRVPHIKAG